MGGYIKQEDVRPITAKVYAIAHWRSYDLTDTEQDFIALLNILQACGESLDSLHGTLINGENEFCDILHNGCWESDREIADALFEFCTFYTEEEFIDWILEKREDYDVPEEYVEDMRIDAADDIFNDVQVTKTEDGYVRRIWC